MPNIASVLREEIARLSRREVRKLTEATKKATAQHRHHIAALNRKIAQLERALAGVARRASTSQTTSAAAAAAAEPAGPRFVAKGLRSHRARLGLSASDFGKLVGVSGNSVYAWEQGTTRPRRGQIAKIAALRTIGKREAIKRLTEMTGTKKRKRAQRKAKA